MDQALTTDLRREPLPAVLPRLIFELGYHLISHLRHRRGRTELDLADLEPPDSALTRKASRLAAGVLPQFLFNHSARSYLFAAAIAKRERIRVDRELLYLGTILHDIGLTEDFDGPRSFEVEGARAARGFLVDAGLEPAKADTVHEAIALHSSLGRTIRHEPEIALVHRGTGVDVIGFGIRAIHPSTREAILDAHPRLAFKTAFTALLRDQARRKPHSHIAGDMSRGFPRLISAAPFDA